MYKERSPRQPELSGKQRIRDTAPMFPQQAHHHHDRDHDHHDGDLDEDQDDYGDQDDGGNLEPTENY